MIDALSKCNPEAIVQISVSCYNQLYPVAYVNPTESSYKDGVELIRPNENIVRIDAHLPDDDEKYMMVQNRKKK